MKYLYISTLWAAYCALHSFLISNWLTNKISDKLKKYFAFYRLFYVIFSLVLLIWLIKYSSNYADGIIIEYSFPLSLIRSMLMYGAIVIFIWAFFFDYDSLHFFGIRQILNMNKNLTINPDVAIKKRGLLGMVRHPMYFALIIYLWTQTFRLLDIYVNIVLTIYVLIGTILEEKKLILEFGKSYEKYQNEVPMLIPFTRPRSITILRAIKDKVENE